MRREFRKAGKEFRYIAVTEYEHHRIHHHVVMSYIDLPVITTQFHRGAKMAYSITLKLLEKDTDFFSLKLVYNTDDELEKAVLNGRELDA